MVFESFLTSEINYSESDSSSSSDGSSWDFIMGA